jgi:hypothetical protein
MKFLFLFLSAITICSCDNSEDKKADNYAYASQKIKRIFTSAMKHEILGYVHYVTIENYDEGDNSFSNFFMDYADKYIDTCKTDLPVWDITFCKPFDFKPHYDSRDDKPLREHSIVSIGYSEETLYKKYPDISLITFYNNGKLTYVQTMTLERMKNAGYYDTNGAYKREWLKEFDKKFKTNYSDTAK